jgi:hypothetical protein
MEDRKKLTAFIIAFTTAAILAEGIEAIAGDWRFFPAVFPMILVCVLFGFLGTNIKQLLIFSASAAFIIVLLDCVEMYFGIKNAQKVTLDFNNSLFIYLFSLFAFMTIFSSFFIALGIILSRTSKIIFRKGVN